MDVDGLATTVQADQLLLEGDFRLLGEVLVPTLNLEGNEHMAHVLVPVILGVDPRHCLNWRRLGNRRWLGPLHKSIFIQIANKLFVLELHFYFCLEGFVTLLEFAQLQFVDEAFKF